MRGVAGPPETQILQFTTATMNSPIRSQKKDDLGAANDDHGYVVYKKVGKMQNEMTIGDVTSQWIICVLITTDGGPIQRISD